MALVALGSVPAGADAIVRTQAMFATTIAELFVEEGRVRVELEIGLPDALALADLLPDALYEKLGRAPEPHAARLDRFFREGLVMAADGQRVPGRLRSMALRERVRRDDVTGEVLPAAAGAEPEKVVFAELEYALPGRPERLEIRGPAGSGIGFVAYHAGIAVNDFRYLSAVQTLLLDWEDPWYTHFERRALRRTYFAPMSGFLYVEPFEVRKEIIARPKDLQRWVDLGLEGRDTIPVEIQPELERRAAEFLRAHQRVLVDGEAIEPELARIHFLERSLRTSRVIDPREELDVHAAILGAIFVYPTAGLPERVTMDWDLWSERIQRVPGASVDQAGPLPVLLEPDFAVLEWQNFLTNPEIPTLRAAPSPPDDLARLAAGLRWLLVAGCAGLLWWSGRGPRRRAVWLAAGLVLTAGCFWLARGAELSRERTEQVVSTLLYNVYRAFDFRDEEAIYDALDRTVTGDLLERTYLETRHSLELASQGGARARVKGLELIELTATPADGGGFDARATWQVAGSVGHWGHVHQRRNRYRAELRVAPVEGAWKLVGLEVLEEERL